MLNKITNVVTRKKTPTTVDEAMGGFMTFLTNLKSVRETQKKIKQDAQEAMQRLGIEASTAETESHRAQAMIEKLEDLLGVKP